MRLGLRTSLMASQAAGSFTLAMTAISPRSVEEVAAGLKPRLLRSTSLCRRGSMDVEATRSSFIWGSSLASEGAENVFQVLERVKRIRGPDPNDLEAGRCLEEGVDERGDR